MKDYYTVIISQRELHATEKSRGMDWVSWCWEYIGIDNFSWTLDIDTNRGRYTYVIRFRYEEDKLLFILNWI